MTANLLDRETSPYLLQHKDNPVHWRPWGEAALARAKAADKPVLLSVGYAACHWCHVMARESFEDDAIAALMNAHFINIKVDREERPDVDRIYMDALHALGEQGGWPLTMFMTPEGEPFWGGTYFPKDSKYGRPGFGHVLREIARMWRDERDKILANGFALRRHLTTVPELSVAAEVTEPLLRQAAGVIAGAVDRERGGFTGAPKFPQGPVFSFLWTITERTADAKLERAVTVTLRNICQSGIYDHLGGGIARYSVDHLWLVPHFEKMLYDNAQLVSLLSRVWSRTREPLFRVRLDETIAFLLRDMRTPEGAFAASYDADSEGEEGKYYVWSDREIRDLLGPAADEFAAVYDVTNGGNFEGHTILNRLADLSLADSATEYRLAASRATLLTARAGRVPPGFDDKVLADWNGLAIGGLAEAALVTGHTEWARVAISAFDAVIGLLWTGGDLNHSWRAGQAKHHATADGYANLITAALRLHAVTGEPRFIARAAAFADALIAHHWNDARGALDLPSKRATELIARPCIGHDDATPNSNAIMIANFAALALLTSKRPYQDKAEAIHRAFAGAALANPFGYASLLESSLALLDPVQAILAGSTREGGFNQLLTEVIAACGPQILIGHVADAAALPSDHPAHRKSAPEGGQRLYLCRGNVCAAPAEDAAGVRAALSLLGF